MKNIYILIVSLLISLSFALYVYLDDYSVFAERKMAWMHKEKEITSRLLAIPILLYHNVDGKGPFSIDAKTLREHFQLIRDRGIRVIPLSELIKRLEHPVPYRDRVIVITFDDGYGSMYTKLLPLVREFGYPITLFVYTDNIFIKSTKYLTWNNLRIMDRAGIDVQSHSISHADLSRLSERDDQAARKQLFEEIYLSKRIIELYTGKRVDFFAFPYGRYVLNTIDLTQKSGYRRVFSTDYGSNIITRDNFCLRRHHIKSNFSLNYIDTLIR